MAYVAPSTVVAGQTYSAANHNIIVNDIIDHEDRLDTVQNAQYPARNVLVNGAMQFSQRGTSVSGISSGQSYYTADRWTPAISANGTWTSAISADAPAGSGFRNSLRMTCNVSAATAASTYNYLSQRLEGQTLQHIKKGTSSAQPLTLQFWVKGSTTGTYVVSLYDWDNTRSVGATYTISAADTWEQKTITFPADTTGALDNDNAVSLDVTFILSAGTDRTSGTLNTTWASFVTANYAAGQTVNLAGAASRYLAVTGVQLEPGSQASPFEFVRYDDELARCQRYYYKAASGNGTPVTHGMYYNTTILSMTIPFPVTMRAAPVQDFVNGSSYWIAYSNNSSDMFDTMAVTVAQPNLAQVDGTGNVSGNTGYGAAIRCYNASASMAFSAEL
jgi:hypothetical protein